MSQPVDAPNGDRALRLRYIVTICAGSFLLFLVQPMVARMALPRLGGAPTVWNSAMVVYQALLLGGYAYAHWLGRFSGRTQAAIHLFLFVAAALTLPVGLTSSLPSADANPVFWVPYLLLTSIGPVFFVIAAQAPLMQRWFSLSGGGDPYPLYAASNIGSFGGLIAYPLLLEPLLPVASQSEIWSAGYLLVLALVVLSAFMMPKAAALSQPTQQETPAPDWRTVGRWIILAAVPSGLMLSTSLHLTTDIVAMPLLWVLPLGLYLLSFSVAFATNRRLADFCRHFAPFVILMAACSAFMDSTRFPFSFALLTLVNLFVVSVALHSEMFARRPHPEHLTRFYLAMSVGGVIGGIFCAILAPLIFDWTYEHPILIIASALLLVPRAIFETSQKLLESANGRAAAAAIALLALVAATLAGGPLYNEALRFIQPISIIVIIGAAVASLGKRWLFAFCLGCLMLTLNGWQKIGLSIQPGMMTRSYFGVYSVRSNGVDTRYLVHGTTVHGVQNLAPSRQTQPTSYYAPHSGIGLAMTAIPAIYGPGARIDIVGLGAGTLACYAKPDQHWTFYEIDPAIVTIASDPKRFTFLSRCLPGVKVVIGDARLTLAATQPNSADVLAIDAFSSDAVPMHLLTAEAFATYRRHIAPDGLLMVHISNRFLDLEPVLAAIARQGWASAARDYDVTDAERNLNYSHSLWIAFSPDKKVIDRLIVSNPAEKWRPIGSRPGFKPWTDDHASILSILKPYKRDN
ncbi:spermidine synthase [Aquisediminimonas profunda]|uniref:spermidine synthase n=1 Tax=Aquisediminimonas profunda TaxID=1550733 RepID=UPI001C637320|nr:fused MFS/spermidine synthase [Aquisediminimonas profunda]